jgi:hypothetical protein
MMNKNTFEQDWKVCFDSFKALSTVTQQVIRNGAVNSMIRRGCEEIGSSDQSHCIFSAWKCAGRDWNQVVINYFEEFAARC